MKYLLGGYYGMRNVGDDVLLYVTLAEVMRVDPHASFTIISHRPEAVPPGARVTIKPGGQRFGTIRHLLRHDAWLFGGGGLLQDSAPRSRKYLARMAQVSRLAKCLGRKILMLGIGVGPLSTPVGRAAAATLLSHSDLITVRDEESLALAKTLAPRATVHLTGDLAFLLPRHLPAAAPAAGAATKTLGVSLLPHAASLGRAGNDDKRLVDSVVHALDRTLAKHPDWRVTLFEFFVGVREYGDSAVLSAVQNQLARPDRVSYRPYTGDFTGVQADLSACSAFLGMRFHSCLLACLAGVPCLMIAYHPKSESLARRLRLGSDAVVSVPLAHDATTLEARVDALLTEGDKFRPQARIDSMISDSMKNHDVLMDWFERHQGRMVPVYRRTR